MTLLQARERLVNLLEDWKAGLLTSPWDIQGDAELIEGNLIDNKLLSPGKEVGGLSAQIDSVLGQLTNAQQQCVMPKDIDVMLSLLSATEGEIEEALILHSKYWNSLDYNLRKKEAEEYWF